MSPNAKPGVGAPNAELAPGLRDVPYVEPDDEQPEVSSPAVEAGQAPERTSEAEPTATGETEPTARTEPERRQKKAKVNLDDFEEFRQWKAESDKRVAEAERRAQEAEQRVLERERLQAEAQAKALEQQLDEVTEPAERARLIDQIGQARGYAAYRQHVAWDQYVLRAARERGLDPEEFRGKPYPSREAFEADLVRAENKRLAHDLAEAKGAASPENIQKLVEQALAKAAQRKGYDQVDFAGPNVPGEDDSAGRRRDQQLVQQGRMSAEVYAKKWAGK